MMQKVESRNFSGRTNRPEHKFFLTLFESRKNNTKLKYLQNFFHRLLMTKSCTERWTLPKSDLRNVSSRNFLNTLKNI